MSRQLQSLVTFQSSSRKYVPHSANFNKFCLHFKGENVNIKNLPLGVLAVLGPHKKLLTDWLIYFYSRGSSSACGSQIPKFLQVENLEKGLYFWPDLCQLSRDDNRPFLILYVQGDSNRMHKLALSICSQALVFGKSQKEEFEKFIANSVEWDKTGGVEVIDVCPNSSNPEATPNSDDFFKVLDTLSVPVKSTSDRQSIHLSTFMPFFENVLAYISEQTAWKNTDALYAKEADQCKINSQIQQPEVDQRDLQSSDGAVPTPEEGTEENAGPDGIPPNNQNKQGNASTQNSQPFDATAHTTIASALNQWLSAQTSPWTPKLLRAPLLPLISSDQQYFQELAQVLKLIDTFGSELRNMFDNYVCFYGDDDSIQLSSFIKTAWSRTVDDFNKKNFLYRELLSSLCKSVCYKLRDIYICHNNQISQNELVLASKVEKKAKKELQRLLCNYFEKGKISEQVFLNIPKTFTVISSRCMDHGGRLSHVHTEFCNNLLKIMNAEIEIYTLKITEAAIEHKSPILYAVYLYQKSINSNVYENPTKFNLNEIIDFHLKTADLVTSGVKSSGDKEIVKDILYGHLKYIVSKSHEHSMINSLATSQQKKSVYTLCIYLLPDQLRMDIMTSSGLLPVIYKSENTPWCPALCVVDKDGQTRAGFGANKIKNEQQGYIPADGYIYNFIRNLVGNEQLALNMLVRLFKLLKTHSETYFSVRIYNTVVLVPSWYSNEYLDRIRSGAKGAGFLEIYVVSEGPIIARQILEADDSQKVNSDLAVAVEVAPSGVIVEIYGMSKSNSKLLEALSRTFTHFGTVKEWVDPTNVLNSCNRISWINLLKIGYAKAMSLLTESFKDRIKYCYLLTEYAEWENAFEEYFTIQENVVVVQKARDKYGVVGAGLLSIDPREVRQILRDYLHVEIADSKSSGTKNLEQKDDSIKEDEALDDFKEYSESDETLIRKKELIQKCKNIQDKLDSGEVKVRKLLLKNITETLKRAVEIANNKYSSTKELECEENEIAELITEHNF